MHQPASSRLTKAPQAQGDAEPPSLTAFLRRDFFPEVGMAARVGEAEAAYPPDPSNALPSTPAMVSQVRCNCMGGSWETDEGWGHPLLPPGCDTAGITSDAAETAQQEGKQQFSEQFGPRPTVCKHSRETQLWGTCEMGQPVASFPKLIWEWELAKGRSSLSDQSLEVLQHH